MTDHEIQELLRRCEREAPSQADLSALEVLLAGQEAAGGWAEIRASLRSGLEAEHVEVVAEVISAAVPGAEGVVPRALRALAEGLAHESRRGEVAAAVIAAAGLEPWLPTVALAAFAEGLGAEAEGLDLADAVLVAIQEAEAPELALSALADGELSGAAREAATALLAADPEALRFLNEAARLGQVLRQGLAREVGAEDLSPIWEGVAATLGLAEETSLVEATLAQALVAGIEAEAGPIDIADLVMGRIAPAPPAEASAPEAAPERQPAPVARPIRPPWYRRLPVLALIGAAAALLLVLQVVGPDGQPIMPADQPDALSPVLELAAVNDTEIEDLEVAESAMVQVFQLDDGAPMVIFIDEGFGGESPEGVTL
ncbi:MAG: hypothetical protein ABIO70_13305 [Pseudomonadota bacterium]